MTLGDWLIVIATLGFISLPGLLVLHDVRSDTAKDSERQLSERATAWAEMNRFHDVEQ